MNSNYNNNLERIDWSFSSINNSGIHSLHWYPATYIAAIPGVLIASLSEKGSSILDPFCGSGTTGLEALRLGNSFIGIDTNPIALLITEAKLYYPDGADFLRKMTNLEQEAEIVKAESSAPTHPQELELRGWYHPDTLAELNSLLFKISMINSEKIRRCALAVFSSILKSLSSQGRHWGWVCDNVKPKASEITYKNAFTSFLNAAEEYIAMSKASFRMLKEISPDDTRSDIRKNYSLTHGDCVENMNLMEENSIDMIMTSPPYYGVADYIKSQRLSYLWFDTDNLSNQKLGFRHFEKLRAKEKGSRSHRHRTNSRKIYLDFIQLFFNASARVLKPGGNMALIVGESKSREATTDALITAGKDSGFDLKLRKQRDIKSTRRRLMAKVKGEDVLIFKNIKA